MPNAALKGQLTHHTSSHVFSVRCAGDTPGGGRGGGGERSSEFVFLTEEIEKHSQLTRNVLEHPGLREMRESLIGLGQGSQTTQTRLLWLCS